MGDQMNQTHKENSDMDQNKTINIEPTLEGYLHMAAMFERQIVDDMPPSRRRRLAEMLDTLIDLRIYIYLAGKDA